MAPIPLYRVAEHKDASTSRTVLQDRVCNGHRPCPRRCYLRAAGWINYCFVHDSLWMGSSDEGCFRYGIDGSLPRITKPPRSST
jgi:hypothetical protein